MNIEIHTMGDEIVYPSVEYKRIKVSIATREFIRRVVVDAPTKIEAIKYLRAEHGLLLKDAKDIVDYLTAEQKTLGDLLRAKIAQAS